MYLRKSLSAGLLATLAASAAACSEKGGHGVAAVSPPEATAAATSDPAPARATAEAKASAAPPVASATAVASASASAAPVAPIAEAPKPPPSGARIYSKGRFAWIHSAPGEHKGWIGYLGLGGSVALKGGSVEKARVAANGGGCEGWYAIEPVGFMCTDDSATIDPNDPVVVALAKDPPKTDSPFPYEYGESTGAPRYPHLPSPEEQKGKEWDLAAHMDAIAKAKSGGEVDKSLEGIDLSPSGVEAPTLTPVSPLVREARDRIALGSTVAWTRSFDFGGRTFLMGHDQAIIPKDRVKPYPKPMFHGVELGSGVDLPLAFFRKKPRPKYTREADGSFKPKGDETFALHSYVGLTGKKETIEVPAPTGKKGAVEKETYLETKEPGVWVLEKDAAVCEKTEPPTILTLVKGGKKSWVDVSVLGGTFVAYEGDKPVYATLISPGRGGIPFPGKDPISTASTPLGTFRVDGKFVTASMVSSSDSNLVHTEVQYIQNFHGAHALHGAYWHEMWGLPKSGGCVNLAPIDAKKMFEWSEPKLPEGWYGMRSTPEAGAATVVVVRR